MDTTEILHHERMIGIKIDQAITNCKRIENYLAELEEKITNIRRQISALERQDMYFAHEWWKDGKYLYHVFPQVSNGKRKRVYIGNDLLAIGTARAKVQRWEHHRDLCDKLAGVENTLRETETTLGITRIRMERSIGDMVANTGAK